MKYIIIGDTHFDAGHEGVSNEMDYQNKIDFFQKQVFPYCKEHNIKNIIQLGDFTDKRTKISTYVLHRLQKDIFDYIEDEGIVLEYIIGNHCIYYKDSLEIFTLSIFEKAYDNFVVYKEPTLNNGILFTPWLLDKDKPVVHKLLDKTNLCIGHFDMKDFNISSTFKSVHGLEQNFFKDTPVISGHYHIKQRKDNILYTGVPYQQSWEDYSANNGFYVLDTNNLKDNVLDSLEFIPNISSTKHIKVFVDSEKKTLNVFGLDEDISIDIKPSTEFLFTNNNKLKIYLDKNNAYNKKIVQRLINDCVSYRVEIPKEDSIKVDKESNVEFNITKTISSNLETDYQKEVYQKILNLSLQELKD